MNDNKCRAEGCDVIIGEGYVMCNKHWKIVPIPLRNAIWRQCHQSNPLHPSTEALRLIARAIQALKQNDR